MSIKDKLEYIVVNYSGIFAILIAGFSYIAVVNNLSFLQHATIAILCITIILWSTVSDVTEKIPNQPSSYYVLGFFLTQLLTFEYIQSTFESTNTFEGFFLLILTLVSGFGIWIICMMIITGILSSTTDIPFDKNKTVDDPYGDKHAARILNDTGKDSN